VILLGDDTVFSVIIQTTTYLHRPENFKSHIVILNEIA